MRGWARRTRELRDELAGIAEPDPRWWLLAGGVALAEPHAPPEVYLACDAEPDGDTFMGFVGPAITTAGSAIAAAKAARTALRELDGTLPDQPLAITLARASGAAPQASELEVAAFAARAGVLLGRLDDPRLEAQLTAVLAGRVPDGAGWTAGAAPSRWPGALPFVCVSLGDEPLETARHGHRRAWTDRGGPWLGLGHSGELTIVSTCHLVVDGYGHARIAARISTLLEVGEVAALPPLAPVVGTTPLSVAWRELPCPTPRVIPLAYELGRILHRDAGHRDARFSPTIQIPVARGHRDDPDRLRRRIVSATTSVRFERGVIEPFAAFDARVRGVIAREASSTGLVSRLLAAARAVPVPLAWKRRSIGAQRPGWLDGFAAVLGGRALLSRIAIDAPIPPLCAVSTPSRLATDRDPLGGCVITIVDDGTRSAITLCGSGAVGTRALLDELLASA